MRAMASAEYRKKAWRTRYEGPSGELNRVIDKLIRKSKRPLPYSGPEYGGVNAEALLLLRDPGPKTQRELDGSGFLSIENDDTSAERLSGILNDVELEATRLVSWNVYPWYINDDPTPAQQDEGVAPLLRIIQALPRLRAVVLMGKTARNAWPERVVPRAPDLAHLKRLPCLLCSGRGITDGSKHTAIEGEAQVRRVYAELRAFLDS